MEIKQKEESFNEIIIIIKTKEEASALMSLCSSIEGNTNHPIRIITGNIFDKLNDFGIQYSTELIKQNMKLKE